MLFRSTLDRSFKKVGRNDLIDDILYLILALAVADSNMRSACTLKNSSNVSEVNVDLIMSCNDLSDSDNVCLKNFISDSIRLLHSETHLVCDKVLVRDNDKSVNVLDKSLDTLFRSLHLLSALKFESILNIVMDLWMVAGLGLGVFGAALATLIAQGISAVFSLLIFLYRMRRYQSPFQWFDGRKLRSMLRIAVPSVLQQSTVSIGMMIVQAVVNPFGTQALAGYAATMRVENVFSLIFVSIGNAVSPYVSQNLGAGRTERIKKGYHAALLLDVCFAALAFLVIETLHTQISSLFLGKDGTALAYQVSGDYMRWLGYFFIFMGIKMATDGVLRGLGIMRPFLIANMVNLAIRLSVALICAPRFGIDFVWLAVPAGWLANFLVSYAALRKSWPGEKVEPSRIFS